MLFHYADVIHRLLCHCPPFSERWRRPREKSLRRRHNARMPFYARAATPCPTRHLRLSPTPDMRHTTPYAPE